MKLYKKIKSILLLLTVIFSQALFAQEFTATVSKQRVSIGEQFVLTFSCNQSVSNFKPPLLDDFINYGGPNQSSSMSFVNGVMSQQISFSYILAAKNEGKFTIQPATVVANGKSLKSNVVNIEVVSAGVHGNQGHGNNQRGSGNKNNQNNQSDEFDLGNNLFMRTVVSKSKVYVGEQIMVSYKVYTRVNIMDNAATKLPVFNGFWSEDIPSKNRHVEFATEVIDGVQYQVAELKKTILIPQHAGSLTVDGMEMDVVTRIKSKGRSNDPFEQLFGMGIFGGYRDVKVSIKSKPVGIKVIPLPSAGKPKDFSGAVGDFSIQVNLKPQNKKMKTNDAGNLILNISGRGNLKMIDPPKIDLSNNCELYDTKTSEKITVTEAGVSGKKSIDYLFIPRNPGKVTISSIPFSYFDPSAARYITLNTPEFLLDVEKSEGYTANPVISSYSTTKEDIKLLGQDILFIKTAAEFTSNKKPFLGSVWFWILTVFPFLLLITVFSLNYRKLSLSSNQEYINRVILEKSSKQLREANKFLINNNYDAFYGEIINSFYKLVSIKFNIPLAQLNIDKVMEKLNENNLEQARSNEIVSFIQKCEMAKYSPIKHSDNMQADYEKANEIFQFIEKYGINKKT